MGSTYVFPEAGAGTVEEPRDFQQRRTMIKKIVSVHPVIWMLIVVVALFLTVPVYLIGARSHAFTALDEACYEEGLPFDGEAAYQRQRRQDGWFPLHQWCTGTDDMVPIWVNPAMVLFWGMAAFGGAMFLFTTVWRLWTGRRR
ncbi:hypothetical protein D5S17_00630 [Pseudonocardiaceae bacterium YIM PH 21723]|nr:hypothetical protein D5S17_00630 [Pseudonocardiaceae bacterium YIM PH 21723]